MKDFLKNTLASCLGITIALIFFTFFIVIFFIAVFASFSPDSTVKIRKDSVLKVELSGSIPELTNNVQTGSFNFSEREKLGYRDMIEAINMAAEDDNISAIVLSINRPTLNVTAANEMLKVLNKASENGKQIFVHGTNFSQSEYYLASVADHISLNRFGSVDFRGFGMMAAFFPDFFKKIGIEFYIYAAGDYKGAGENFYRHNFSDPNREQLEDILFKSYDLFLETIAKNRGLSEEKLREIADNMLSRDDFSALEIGLVDAIETKKEFERRIKGAIGIEEDKEIREVSLADYFRSARSSSRSRSSDQIAVIYAEGMILDGKDQGGVINDEPYVNAITSIAENDNIKAVVLRVNSGGGSIIASDNIFRALESLKATGKPLVASMGDVAASGGYYISAPADVIFAEPQTITGSIGVIFMIPNTAGLIQDKLAFHFDSIATGPNALKFLPIIEFSDFEHEYYQERVEEAYRKFVQLMADSRNLTYEQVHQVAQGRVWMGEDAFAAGLVDNIGSLQDAIDMAASLAEIEDFRIRNYPQIKDPFTRFLEEIMGESISLEEIALKRLNTAFTEYTQWQHLSKLKGHQALFPYSIYYN
jgi:protease-4